MTYGPEAFIARLTDDSMYPDLCRGDFIYVDPDVPMRSGDLVAVRLRGKTMARRLQEQDGQLVLRTLLPDEVECFVTASNETMILGVVVFIGRRV